MNILALDTCTDTGSIALALDREVVYREPLPAGWRSTTLHGEIERVLNQHGLTTAQLDGYAVTAGPGSFTGVRIGLTAAKALAEVHGKPLVPVSTLEVIATSALMLSESRANVLIPLLDARRGQVFGGIYRRDGNCLRGIADESVSSLAALLERVHPILSGNELWFCGIDLQPFASQIRAAGFATAALASVPPDLAEPLCRIALAKLRSNNGVDALTADANYVRLSDAELFWKG